MNEGGKPGKPHLTLICPGFYILRCMHTYEKCAALVLIIFASLQMYNTQLPDY